MRHGSKAALDGKLKTTPNFDDFLLPVSAYLLVIQYLQRFIFLQVWGLFAPKFVFDVAGLVLTDLLICLASFFYFHQVKDDPLH